MRRWLQIIGRCWRCCGALSNGFTSAHELQSDWVHTVIRAEYEPRPAANSIRLEETLRTRIAGAGADECLYVGERQELKKFDADYRQSPAVGPELDQAISAIVRSTNQLRSEQGREPLKTNSKLTPAPKSSRPIWPAQICFRTTRTAIDRRIMCRYSVMIIALSARTLPTKSSRMASRRGSWPA